MMRSLVCTAVVCLGLVLLLQPASAADTINKRYNLGASPTVDLANVNGPVTVTGAAGPQVVLRAVKQGGTAAQRARLVIELEPGARQLRVRARCKGWLRSWGCGRVRVSYTVQVPRATRLTVRSVNGAVKLRGVQGEVNARTVNGKITARQTGQAPLTLKTVNGTISASDVGGTVRANSVSGALRLSLQRVAGQVRVRSVSGPVELRLPRDAAASVALSTVSGELASQLPLQAQQRRRRSLEGRLGRGGPLLTARTVSGSVSILSL